MKSAVLILAGLLTLTHSLRADITETTFSCSCSGKWSCQDTSKAGSVSGSAEEGLEENAAAACTANLEKQVASQGNACEVSEVHTTCSSQETPPTTWIDPVTKIKYKYAGGHPYASQLAVCNNLGENWMPLLARENMNKDIATRFFFSPLAKYQGENDSGNITLSIKVREDLPSGCSSSGHHGYIYVSRDKLMTGQLIPADFKTELDLCPSGIKPTFCALKPKP